MIRTVEKGKTLLIDGPASVTVSSGNVEVLGVTTLNMSKVVVREGKRLPFAVEEKATFDLSLAEKAAAEEVEGNTIPPSWVNACEELLKLDTKPTVAMVLGTVDSGKTSFCTYLVNKLLHQKKKVAVLDGDLGQSDIGPPCTVAYTFVGKPVTDLFNLRAKNAIFIGVTSPSGATDKMKESMVSLKKEIIGSDPDFVVMNSDGWVEGEEAVKYKAQLVEAIKPSIIFYLQLKEELLPLLSALQKFRIISVDSPSVINQRSREKRKNLRELGYQKYLRNAKVQSFPLSWLKIEDEGMLGLSKTRTNIREARKIYDVLGMKPLHFTEQIDKISVIIGRRRWINPGNLKKAEEATGKKIVVIRKGEEEGLLTALYNAERKFLGIGVVQEIDYLRKTLKFLSPVSENITTVVIGRVKLDKNMKEILPFGEENHSESTSFSKLF